SKLFIGGHFSTIGATVGFSVMRWNGTTLAPAAPNGGVNDTVNALASFDDGAGASLFALGRFDVTNLAAAANIARYGRHGVAGCDPITGETECLGDGSGEACPCANFGSAGRGCENASGSGGALLEALGQSAPAAGSVLAT